MTVGQEAGISGREVDVLAAVGEHLSNAQIAHRLHISVRTVESHVSSLLRKLGASDRRELARLAPAAGDDRAGPGSGTLHGQPTPWTSFVGRATERAEVLGALEQARLVNLVGPGGVGKTRLAIEVATAAARSFPFGGGFVDLVPVREGFLDQAVAAVLGVTESPGQRLEDGIQDALRAGRCLLVLDNCEHLLDAAAGLVARLLAGCPELTVLTTSRERLGVPGERVVPVPPLSLTGKDGSAGHSEAAALFLDRAGSAHADLAAEAELVGQVCARLDGMPLALELAAARTASLGMDGLLAGLSDRLRLLSGSRGADERHRSLRSVIDWSHELLDDDERRLFRRLGVFAGGFDLDAATAVAADEGNGHAADVVGRLADKSLLVHIGNRWRLLETVREYALDQLASSGEHGLTQRRHLAWARAAAAALEARVPADDGWQDEFDLIADDLRAALAAVSPGTEDAAVAHALARSLGSLGYLRRFFAESRRHYERSAAFAATEAQAATDLQTAADVAIAEFRADLAFDLMLDAAARAQRGGSPRIAAIALSDAAITAARFPAEFPEAIPFDRLRPLFAEAQELAPEGDAVVAAHCAAAAAWITNDRNTDADPVLAEAALEAARVVGDPVLISGALDAVCAAAATSGHFRRSQERDRERLELFDRMPRDDPRTATETVDVLHMAIMSAIMVGDLPHALAVARRAQTDDIMNGTLHSSLSKLIMPLALQGSFDEAIETAEQTWARWRRVGSPAAAWLGPSLCAVGLVHGLRGDLTTCGRWLARAADVGHAPEGSMNDLARCLAFVRSRVALHAGRIDGARAAAFELPADPGEWYDAPSWYHDGYAWSAAAEIAVVAGLPDAEQRLAVAAPAGVESNWGAACLARARGRLHDDPDALRESVDGWERIGARFERAVTLLLLPDRVVEGRAELAALGCALPGGVTPTT